MNIKILDETAWLAAMARVGEVTGARTQVQLAEVFGVRQSSISDAKRRGSIPSDWLLTLVLRHMVNPEWIQTGQGPRNLTDQLPKEQAALRRQVEELRFELRDMQERLELALLLASMTPEELAAYKAMASDKLRQGLDQVRGMSARLLDALQGAGMEA